MPDKGAKTAKRLIRSTYLIDEDSVIIQGDRRRKAERACFLDAGSMPIYEINTIDYIVDKHTIK